MRRFDPFLGLAVVAIVSLIWAPHINAQTLRYTVTANVPGIVWGTALPNCVTNECSITITGVGDAANATSFPLVCVGGGTACTGKGTGAQGNLNRPLTNMSVTVYDPIAGVTYGPAALPASFFTSIDNFNGGIGFGSEAYGGPAYPVSIGFVGGPSEYFVYGIDPFYDLKSPVLAGGLFNNCPTSGLACLNIPPPAIPVTLANGAKVPLSVPVPLTAGFYGKYWVQEEPPTNQWAAAASMQQARSGHTATLLPSDKVLVVGGAAGTTAATTPEIYDPVANTWTSTAAPSCGRTSHTATLLADGRVLVVGGMQCPTSAEIFNPATGTWSTAATIPVSFPGPTAAVRLQDNRVLVAGANGAEMYDAVGNTWSATGFHTPFSNPVAATLSTGSVMILDNVSCALQFFDPVTAGWTQGAVSFCSDTTITATSLATGNVLVTGTRLDQVPGFDDVSPQSMWSLYQTASSTFDETLYPNAGFDLYTLPVGGNAVAQALSVSDGRVLLVGGDALVPQPSAANPTPTVPLPAPISPLFDPSTSTWTPKPALSIGRTGHAVVTLQNGDVLAIGGQSIGTAPVPLASVERLNMGTVPPAVPPYFSLAGGTYYAPQSLVLEDTNPGAAIYYTYTANGSTPTTSSTVYCCGVYIDHSGVVEAIATEPYHAPSTISSATYTIGAPAVTLTPTSLAFASTAVGSTTAAQVVTIKNSGTATLNLTSETITGTNPTSFIKSATTCGTTLAAAATCTVSVEFKPTTAGALKASLSIADNATGSPQAVALTGTGTAPAVTLTPTSLTFASTLVGSTTAAKVVTIKNSGTAMLNLTSETITGTNPTSFIKSATTCGTTLAAAASCTVSVEFKPAATGALKASLSIADNATGSPQAVTLTGTGTAPAVTLTPTSLAFASTLVGSTTAAKVVTIKNSGTATLNLTSETITGTNPTSFIKSATTCGTTLAAAATCTVSVEFKPTTAGALKASLSIADNATGSPQAVALTGTGTAPAVTLTPTSLTFASTLVGSTTAAKVVTIKNSGTAMLNLTSETITGTNPTSFIKSATTCGTTLAAAASCTVSVEFKPAATGALKASLSIADNATGSPQAVALTGTGTAPAVTLTPTSLAFASTSVGSTTAAKVVTIKNSGTATLSLTSETITGTNPTSFIKSATTCGTTLAAAATCTVSVEFKPTTAGALKASLSIADNATGSPQAVALTGTGTAPAVTLTPTSLAFASTLVGSTTSAKVVTIKNSGTAMLNLTSETITGTNPTSFIKSATTCGTTLAAAASCTVSVEFKPAATGALKASLSIADNATGSPQAVTLTGTGTAPAVTLTPTSLAFASTLVGSTTAAKVVTIKNSGTATLNLTSETITGTNPTSFIKSATTCGTTLAAAATCTVSVEFKPTTAGALKASLSIADNATGSPQAVALGGTGN